ncbi:MAG: DUF2059 domain-containing protein, partial [Mucilaginibacter polytrichastri]|nr:DUF2059 domain-containing protein [Mucilaginibacter polytrichastri]
ASTGAFAQTKPISESHLKAANAVLEVSGMAQSFTATIDNMIETQAQQIPDSLQTKFKGVMKTFMAKYFTYDKIKPGMAKIYAAEFTEPELKELAKFYQTPVGKKSAQKLPVLQQKGMELGVSMVQQHQGELQQMMQDAFKK